MIVVFTTRRKDIGGIVNAEKILNKNLRRGLDGLGKRLKKSAHTRMRKDLGKSRQSLKIQVKGRRLSLDLYVYTSLVQAVVDARGIKPGRVFPPYAQGTKLYGWASRRRNNYIPSEESKSGKKFSASKTRPNAKVARSTKTITKTKSIPVPTNSRKALRQRDVRRIAFLVARKIYEQGRKASNWDIETLKANKRRISTDVNNSITRAVREINNYGN